MKTRHWYALGVLVVVLAATTACNRPAESPKGFPGAKWMGPSVESSYSKGRPNGQITKIIFYTTEHSAEKAAALWKSSRDISGHYIVTANGNIWQFVSDLDTAFHAGNRSFNDQSIAIALEGYADPLNLENRTGDCSWQTMPQFKAAIALTRWLSESYRIPLDRTHLIGKNQVPGVSTSLCPSSGRQFWGGATNKFAPGPTWNWERFSVELGRLSSRRVIEAIESTTIFTAPSDDAPQLGRLWAGQRVVTYDETDGFYLIYTVGRGYAQPSLPSGDYHWDGWVNKKYLRAVERAEYIDTQSSFPKSVPLYSKPSNPTDSEEGLFIAAGKCFVVTGKTEVTPDGRLLREIYYLDPDKPTTAWVRLGVKPRTDVLP